MPTKKKAAAKKPAKKSAKKPAAKAAKTAKPKAKVSKKTSAKKPAKKTVAVKPVTKDGVVTMKSVDDPGTATSGDPVTVKPSLDKETGVVTMVPNQ